MFKQRKQKIFLIVLGVCLFLSGCSLEGRHAQIVPPNSNSDLDVPMKHLASKRKTIKNQLLDQSRVKKFQNYDELADFLENNDVSSGNSAVWGGDIMLEESMDFDLGAVKSMAKMADGEINIDQTAGSDDFSKTNVQVDGVDEADIIKTNGQYIYALSKNNLFIVDAYPGNESQILTKIEFKSRPNDIYINGNFLVVFGRDSDIYNRENSKMFRRRSDFSFLKVFDVSDPKNPKQVRDLDIEGSYTNSRMIGDYVYFVTTKYNYYYIEDEPILPLVVDGGEAMLNSCEESDMKCFSPDVYYFDIPYDVYNFTTITAINVQDNTENINGEVYLMSNTQNMYVSPNNIYITYTKYISEYQLEMEVARDIIYPLLNSREKNKIDKIEEAENFILSKSERENKVRNIIERYVAKLDGEERKKIEEEIEKAIKLKYEDISQELEKTVIHKIMIDKNNIDYKTTGEVVGHVLNQFSMDEQNGYFHIATTKNRTWSRYTEEERESYNNLYILDEDLKQVGGVEKLAMGERIYSVRFMQGRAYMVTFKQTDPLFVIDTSDPKNPKVLGELKIPGFSNYLHPYDENKLIGIGKDTNETEWGGVRTKGIKLSLFDVADVKNPKEIDTYVMGDAGSDSIALYDHKAFLFSLEKNLLVMPVSIRESIDENSWGKVTFRGAAVFKVEEDGFNFQGKIDHLDNLSEKSDYWGGYNYYDDTVKRSLYIDDVLYTFSNKSLKLNKLEDLSLVKMIMLEKEKNNDNDFDIIN